MQLGLTVDSLLSLGDERRVRSCLLNKRDKAVVAVDHLGLVVIRAITTQDVAVCRGCVGAGLESTSVHRDPPLCSSRLTSRSLSHF